MRWRYRPVEQAAMKWSRGSLSRTQNNRQWKKPCASMFQRSFIRVSRIEIVRARLDYRAWIIDVTRRWASFCNEHPPSVYDFSYVALDQEKNPERNECAECSSNDLCHDMKFFIGEYSRYRIETPFLILMFVCHSNRTTVVCVLNKNLDKFWIDLRLKAKKIDK
jgi:hypothetical protein